MMRYIIYKITNIINGKYYIGRLATENINDDYMAGKIGGKIAISKKDSAWHVKGGSVASRKKAALYKYKLTTPDNKIYYLDGNTLKAMCKEHGWNYWTLIWIRHKNKPVASGPLRGFRLEKISKPVSKIVKED